MDEQILKINNRFESQFRSGVGCFEGSDIVWFLISSRPVRLALNTSPPVRAGGLHATRYI